MERRIGVDGKEKRLIKGRIINSLVSILMLEPRVCRTFLNKATFF